MYNLHFGTFLSLSYDYVPSLLPPTVFSDASRKPSYPSGYLPTSSLIICINLSANYVRWWLHILWVMTYQFRYFGSNGKRQESCRCERLITMTTLAGAFKFTANDMTSRLTKRREDFDQHGPPLEKRSESWNDMLQDILRRTWSVHLGAWFSNRLQYNIRVSLHTNTLAFFESWHSHSLCP